MGVEIATKVHGDTRWSNNHAITNHVILGLVFATCSPSSEQKPVVVIEGDVAIPLDVSSPEKGFKVEPSRLTFRNRVLDDVVAAGVVSSARIAIITASGYIASGYIWIPTAVTVKSAHHIIRGSHTEYHTMSMVIVDFCVLNQTVRGVSEPNQAGVLIPIVMADKKISQGDVAGLIIHQDIDWIARRGAVVGRGNTQAVNRHIGAGADSQNLN